MEDGPHTVFKLAALPRKVWLLSLGYTISLIGSGLYTPNLFVYLTATERLPVSTASLVMTSTSLSALAVMPLSGRWVDRSGARRVMTWAVPIVALGISLFAWTHGPLFMFLAAIVNGAGGSATWIAFSSAIAEETPTPMRNAVFGLNNALQNFGLGLGSLTEGILLSSPRPHTFTHLFVAAALVTMVFEGVVVASRSRSPLPFIEDTEFHRSPELDLGYRTLIKNRPLVALTILHTAIMATSVIQLNVAYAAWSTHTLHLPLEIVNLAFTANCWVIVLIQWPVVRQIHGRRRSRAAGLGSLFFGMALSLMAATPTIKEPRLLSLMVVVSAVILGLGESLISPTLPALINDLSPAQSRGRYNAFFNLSWPIAAAVGPAITGLLLSAHLGALLWTGFTVVSLLSGFTLFALGRRLSERLDRGIG